MKILWLTNIPTPYTVPFWRELGNLVDLHVVCLATIETNRQWEVSMDGISTTLVNARPIKAGAERTLYAPSTKLFGLIRQRPDLIVLDGWESPAFWQARILSKIFRVRVIMSYWSTQQTHRFSTGPIAIFRGWFFRTAYGVITPGPAASDAVEAMGVASERIFTGFGTVDVARFSREARRIRAGLPSRPGHHFLYVGQLIPRKNVQALLEAFNSARHENDTLTIVGSGPLESDLRALAAELDMSGAVTFAGHQNADQLMTSYAAADTLVLPSTEEVWGLVVNEALSAGLSAVVSDQCGVSRSVADMPAVYLTQPTPNRMAIAIDQARRDSLRPDESHPISAMTPAALAHHLLQTFALHQA